MLTGCSSRYRLANCEPFGYSTDVCKAFSSAAALTHDRETEGNSESHWQPIQELPSKASIWATFVLKDGKASFASPGNGHIAGIEAETETLLAQCQEKVSSPAVDL